MRKHLLTLVAAWLLLGCANRASPPPQASTPPFDSARTEAIFDLLLADTAAQRGDPAQAVAKYIAVAERAGVALPEPVMTFPALAFPDTVIGETGAQTRQLTISNSRTRDITYSVAETDDFKIDAESCATRTVPGDSGGGAGSCTITWRFQPVLGSGEGNRQATLTVSFAGTSGDPAPSDASAIKARVSSSALAAEIRANAPCAVAIQVAKSASNAVNPSKPVSTVAVSRNPNVNGSSDSMSKAASSSVRRPGLGKGSR